jgi:hypothetical protein
MIALAFACISRAARAEKPANYVGGQVCSRCHAAEAERWKTSHHALAMQKATEATVFGDFAHGQIEHFGVTSTFSGTVTGSWSALMVRMARCTNIRSTIRSGSIRCSNT